MYVCMYEYYYTLGVDWKQKAIPIIIIMFERNFTALI